MAVPDRRNGMMDDDENEEEGLFEEEDMVELDSDTPPHLQPLAEAAQAGDVNALRHALDNLSGSIDEPVEDGDTALHLACLYGYLPCVQVLLERGANMETKDEDGAIPLHDACASGFTEIVRLLINSANNLDCAQQMLDTVDVEGDTPLHHAARGEHVDVIQLLLASGASPTKANIYGKIPSELSDPETRARGILEAAANAVAC
ncbi:poly [ADP-ribose] polymerase tankyrase-like [Telopea speciosissima]|uniref:poly [ADP-ribose] polymerase tankyrase-like n=1 Tax=Telopea speciosissima TaxID=54955 RepID=UPI001CC41DF1|nr:poly [ADP-ribose] polymerase tankyrase-like [Telopea speciosissima]